MPFLVRFLIHHALVGLAIAIAAVGLIMWSDISGLGTLIRNAEQSLLAIVLLTVMMGLTFSSLQMGFAVMLLPGDKESGSGGKRKLRDWLDTVGLMPPMRPVRVKARQPDHQ
jgi:membrane glycosyltransferase